MFLYTVHLQCFYLDTTPLKIPISIYHIKKTREKRNIRSLLNPLYIYTCIYEYSQCEGLHPLPPSPFLSLSLSSGATRFFAVISLHFRLQVVRKCKATRAKMQSCNYKGSRYQFRSFGFASLHIAVASLHFPSFVIATRHFFL